MILNLKVQDHAPKQPKDKLDVAVVHVAGADVDEGDFALGPEEVQGEFYVFELLDAHTRVAVVFDGFGGEDF